MREEQRQRLAHWLPLFRDATPGQPSRGDGLLAEAEQIERQLRQLDLERHAPLLSPALAMLEENNLERFQAHARQVLEARTWLARLNPLRLLRRGRLRRFLREHGEADDDSRLAALLGAATWSASGGRCAGNWRRCNRAWGWRQSPPMPVRN